MAIRVTQNIMYNNMVGHMQQNLSNYMESVQQGSSQKKINRPSDDPAGTYRVLTTRNDMVATDQYQENVDTARGWLNLADQVLSTNVTTAIAGLKTLAEQASTGTYDAAQRLIMADQARQYFGQLLNLSNTQFEDMHIFAGHKYDASAFQQGLAPTSWDENWEYAINNGSGTGANKEFITVEGSSERSVLIQFLDDADLSSKNTDGTISYKWSNDGGMTWNVGKVEKEGPKNENGELIEVTAFKIEPAGVGVTFTIPADMQVPDPENEGEFKTLSVMAGVDDEDKFGANNGTFVYLRPAAFYQGDDKDPPVNVTIMGTDKIKNEVDGENNPVTATGTFGSNMLVRIDGVKNGDAFSDVNLYEKDQKFQWSYSTDGGNTWITAYAQTDGSGTVRLPVPSGYVDFDINGLPIPTDSLPAGMQANIHPSRADLDYEIMKDTYLTVNSVGKDVFGGYYEGKPAMSDNDYNLFEVVGSFIGYLEGNNQEGCQRTLAALTKAEEKVLAEATRIGGLENRVEMAADVLSFQKIDQQERLSYNEDIDLTELLTKLTRQQLTYQTVLQSSSMIMKLSLMNYI